MATLQEYAKTQGFQDNAPGQGNAALNMAMGQSLSGLAKSEPQSQLVTQMTPEARTSVNMFDNSSYAKSQPNQLSNQIAPITPVTPAATDNTTMINNQYANFATALKSQIQQSINNKNLAIAKLPEQYQAERNASEVSKVQQNRSLQEMIANQGDRGGMGRSNIVQIDNAGQSRLNDINLAQEQQAAGLRNDIENLTLEGNVQEANMKVQELKDLIANNTAMNNTNYQRQFDAQGREIQSNQFNQQQGQQESQFGRQLGQNQSQFDVGQQNWNTSNTQDVAQNKLINQQYIDTTKYNQGRDTASDKLEAEKTAYDRATTAATNRGFINPTAGQTVTEEQRLQLFPFANKNGGYAQAAIDLASSNPELSQAAKVLSNEKMFANQELLDKYGQRTLQGQIAQSGLKTDTIQQASATLDNAAKQYNIDNMLPQELARAKQLVSIGEVELAAGLFTNSKAPELFKAKMKEMSDKSAQDWAQIRISDKNASTSAGNLKWMMDPENPDNLYKNAQVDQLKSGSGKLTETDIKNQGISQLSQILDSMTPEKQTEYLKQQKYNIIKDYGQSAYNSLNQ